MVCALINRSDLAQKGSIWGSALDFSINADACASGRTPFDKATDYYTKALSIHPKDVNARTQLASCLFYSGEVD
jgi:Tfp pilus assembly protein PilF